MRCEAADLAVKLRILIKFRKCSGEIADKNVIEVMALFTAHSYHKGLECPKNRGSASQDHLRRPGRILKKKSEEKSEGKKKTSNFIFV